MQPVHELGPLSLHLVQGTAQSRLWNEYIARYHYLGYTPMSGAQLRYNVFAGEQLVACISFGASAWKLKDRERFIGWSEEHRARNLQLPQHSRRLLHACPSESSNSNSTVHEQVLRASHQPRRC